MEICKNKKLELKWWYLTSLPLKQLHNKKRRSTL